MANKLVNIFWQNSKKYFLLTNNDYNNSGFLKTIKYKWGGKGNSDGHSVPVFSLGIMVTVDYLGKYLKINLFLK